MDKQILILGAKGMLGQALAEVFRDQTPRLWDKEEVDVTDPVKTKERILALKPDIIINCVAMTDVDGCENNPEAAKALNSDAVRTLAQLCNETGATLVHYSTGYVFDGSKKDAYTEGDSPNPINVYGATKLAGEKEAAKAEKYYILRLERLFGRSGAGKKSFVEKIMGAAKGKTELEVVDEEWGSPTYTPDLAKLTRKILEEGLDYGLYHCANQGSCTWYGFAKEIFNIARIKVKLKPVPAKAFPRPAHRPANSTLITRKLVPMRFWQEALKEFLAQK